MAPQLILHCNHLVFISAPAFFLFSTLVWNFIQETLETERYYIYTHAPHVSQILTHPHPPTLSPHFPRQNDSKPPPVDSDLSPTWRYRPRVDRIQLSPHLNLVIVCPQHRLCRPPSVVVSPRSDPATASLPSPGSIRCASLASSSSPTSAPSSSYRPYIVVLILPHCHRHFPQAVVARPRRHFLRPVLVQVPHASSLLGPFLPSLDHTHTLSSSHRLLCRLLCHPGCNPPPFPPHSSTNSEHPT